MYTETFEKFKNAKNDVEIVLYGKQLMDELDKIISESSAKVLEEKEIGKYSVEDCCKVINILMKKTNTINPKVVDELTDAEIRSTYKVTETALKSLGKTDLIKKYKTITESKSIKIENK